MPLLALSGSATPARRFVMPANKITFSATAIMLVALIATACSAQLLEEATPTAQRYGDPVVGQFRVGAVITAKRGACRNIRAMVAVPLECSEQNVRIVSEDFSSDVQAVKYRDLQGGARQMMILIPSLAAGAEARAVVTFEVATRPVLPPADDLIKRLQVPDKPPRNLRSFVSASPYIEARHGRVRSIVRDITEANDEASSTDRDDDMEDGSADWRTVEQFYDYVLKNIEYVEGPDKSAVQTLKDGAADCHGRSAVFIALCRAAKIPARVVWVNNHCYAEFYMEDDQDQGYWFPIESAGSRAFGEMPLARVILQKGDNFRVPERPRDRLRYASDFLVGLPVPGAGQPKVKYIREQL